MESSSGPGGDETVDEGMLSEVFEVLGDGVQGLVAACDLFLAGLPDRLADADAAVAEGRMDDAARAAHSARGSAGAFGAARLRRLGETLEHACRDDDAPSARTALADMRAEFEVFRAILTSRLARVTAT